jgi:hypothetical protein
MAQHFFAHLSTSLLLALGLSAALASGCGTTEPEQACLDFADALASAGARCGFPYEVNFDDTVDRVAGGDCADIDSVRDLDAFESVCLPFIRQMTCQQLNQSEPDLPDACLGQLRR